ncbi:MAG TPA: hypothetical protein ENI80_11445 [Acidiferrobacteraceae bacterium]|nr:hypothetical protein [Acidiferrobacteraceae bacterium]
MPRVFESGIATNGNPWLVVLLPLAMKLGEPLRLRQPVDRTLHKNMGKLMSLWSAWYEDIKRVPLEMDIEDLVPATAPGRNALFFSGGVDSFFSLLKHEEEKETVEESSIDDLLCVHGFDIALKNRSSFSLHQRRMQDVADSTNKQYVGITTNLRTTMLEKAGWGRLSFGSAFASIALLLGERYRKVFFASTGQSDHLLAPWGSHPLADYLFSTASTEFVHDGFRYSRVEKTKEIAANSMARKYLHVCYVKGNDKNCGKCIKCYRTMITLDVLGCLEEFKVFRNGEYNVSKIRRIYAGTFTDRDFFLQIRFLALQEARNDIIEALNSCFAFTRHRRMWLPITRRLGRRLGRWLGRQRFLWRYHQVPEKLIKKF